MFAHSWFCSEEGCNEGIYTDEHNKFQRGKLRFTVIHSCNRPLSSAYRVPGMGGKLLIDAQQWTGQTWFLPSWTLQFRERKTSNTSQKRREDRHSTPIQDPLFLQAHLSLHWVCFSALNSPLSHLQPDACHHFTWNILHHHPCWDNSHLFLLQVKCPWPPDDLDAKAMSTSSILS